MGGVCPGSGGVREPDRAHPHPSDARPPAPVLPGGGASSRCAEGRTHAESGGRPGAWASPPPAAPTCRGRSGSPHTASAGFAGPARLLRGTGGEHAAARSGLSGRPAAGARLTLWRPWVRGAGLGRQHPEAHAAATPTARAVRGELRAGPRAAGARRGPWEARGGRGEGGDGGGGRAASPGRTGVRRGAAGAERASERLRPRM